MGESAFLASVILPIDWHLCQVDGRSLPQGTFHWRLLLCRRGSTRSSCKGINDGTTLLIFHPLKQPCLMPFGFLQKSRESRSRETCASLISLSRLAQFRGDDRHSPLRPPRKYGIQLRFTGNPLVLHKGIEHANVKGVIADGNRLTRQFLRSEDLIPVVVSKELDAFAFLDHPFLLGGCGKRLLDKHIVIGDLTVRTLASLCQTIHKHRSWGLTQSGMIHLIIDLIRPFTEKGIEIFEGPDGQATRVHFTRDRSRDSARLGIAR